MRRPVPANPVPANPVPSNCDPSNCDPSNCDPGNPAHPTRSSSPGRARKPLARWATGCAWGTALLLIALVVLRYLQHDANFALIRLNAFTFYIYLPAYAILAWAVARRRPFLAGLALVVAACHLTWVLPDFLPTAERRPPVTSANHPVPRNHALRIFYCNLNWSNTHYDELFAEIAEADPDLIVLVEYCSQWYQQLQATSLTRAYPYQSRPHSPTSGNIGLLSRYPLTQVRHRWIGRKLTMAADVAAPTGQLQVLGVHSPRPQGLSLEAYHAYWEEVLAAIAAETGPLVVVGDFNATQHARGLQRLTAGRLQSVHELCGRGYATTWPNGEYLLPPIRIDHAFVSPELRCLRVTEGIGLGSDHRPIIFDLRLAPMPPTTATTSAHHLTHGSPDDVLHQDTNRGS